MSLVLAKVGEATPLSLIVADGTTTLFPQARIYDADNSSAFISSVDLTHINGGYYAGTFTPVLSTRYVVVYTVFTDVGHTTVSPIHGKAGEIVATDFDFLTVGESATAQLNVSYEDAPQIVRIATWLDRDGKTVTTPISSTITVKDEGDVTLYTQSSLSPFPDGVFFFQQQPVFLADNRLFYVEVTVTDTIGSVTNIQTFTTVA